MQIKTIEAAAWDIPMRQAYRSAQRVTTTARNVLVTVTTDGGIVGYGESAPATYVTGETQASVLAALHGVIALRITGSADDLLTAAKVSLHEFPGAFSALAMAVLDAKAQAAGLPLYRFLGAPADVRPERATDLSLPILTLEQASEQAASAAMAGFHALKIKVGSGDADEDAARVRAIAAAAPNVTLRLDGNQGFTGDGAVEFIDGLSDLSARIEMFEQPTKAHDDAAMAYVAQRIACPVFADESVHNPEDARRLVETGVCGGVVLKLAKADLLTVREIAQAVFAAGGKSMFGCMMETHVAVTAALHLAIALGPEVVPMLDLDGHLLTNDAGIVEGGLTQVRDVLAVDPGVAGIGVRVSPFVPAG